MVQKYDCSTPFGLASRKICMTLNISEYQNVFFDIMRNKSNPYPCKYLGNFYMLEKKTTLPGVHVFSFSSFTEKLESRYSYGFIDLFADLGGYLGIFLGTSLFQLKDVFAYFLKNF